LSQVKSAKANGVLAGCFVAPGLPLSVACPATGAGAVPLEIVDALTGTADAGVVANVADSEVRFGAFTSDDTDADGSEAADELLLFDSSSATRFSSCSTRSRSHCSRSVSAGVGTSGLSRSFFVGGSFFPSSSATSRLGNRPAHKTAASKVTASSRFVLNKVFSSLRSSVSTLGILRSFHTRFVHSPCTAGCAFLTSVPCSQFAEISAGVDHLLLPRTRSRLRAAASYHRSDPPCLSPWAGFRVYSVHLASIARGKRSGSHRRGDRSLSRR
jgi:hypothetical protein